MKITLNGQDFELTPFEFECNEYLAHQYFGYNYTQYLNSGDTLDLAPIYSNIYREHKDDAADWVGDPEVCAHVEYESAYGVSVNTDITVTPSHVVGATHLQLLFWNPYTSTGFTAYADYGPLAHDTPFTTTISLFNIKAINTSFYGSSFGICCGSHPVDNGGFIYRHWKDTLINPDVELITCDFSDLDRYPTPDPAIPFSYSPWSNELKAYCICTPKAEKDVEWNDEIYIPKTPDDDINTPDTSSGPYHDTSDFVDFDSAPVNGPLDTGFIKAYVVDHTQCQAIANFMLTDNFLTNVKKLFANPIDYIISLHFLPITPSQTTATDVIIGGVDTEVDAPRTYDNYVDFSCGSVKLDEFWGSFIDYDCTKVAIYIPFIGIRDLNTDDVMTGTLTLQYRVNVLDGDFVVSLKSNTSHKLNGVIAQYQGNMLLSTPVTALDYSNKFSAAFTALSALPGIAAGNAGSMVQGAAGMLEATLSKPMIQRSGNISGGAGMLGNFTPYLIKTRPKQAVPSLFTKLFGKPSMIGGKLDDFTGYTKIAKVNLSGVACTDAERDEILQLLEEGVFV